MSNYTSNIYLSSGNISLNTHPASAVIPLQLKDYNDPNIEFNQTRVRYSDGYSVYKSDLFNSVKDIKYNHNSLMWLTSSYDYNEFLIEKTELSNIQDYIDTFGFVYTFILSVPVGIGLEYPLFNNSTVPTLTTQDVGGQLQKIDKTDNNKINISQEGYYITVDLNTKAVSYETQTNNSSKLQSFDYLLDDDFLYIFYEDENSYRYIGVADDLTLASYSVHSNRYDNVSLLTSITASKHKQQEFVLWNENLGNYKFGNDYSKNTSWIHYYNELADKANLKNVEINKPKSFDSVKVNHLIVSPYETTIDPSTETIYIEHLPLKNMMTPEQNYTVQPKRREYQKIFSGDKDYIGYEKPLLTYSAETKLQILESDENTYFHYPIEAEQISISDSGLIESGAIPGSTPYNSDKIFKKNADYKNFIHWGDSQQIFGCDDGTWLCSWLSGSNGATLSGMEDSIWVDRWYDPSKLTESGALTIGYNQKTLNEKSPIFFDIPSEMTFDPGVYYYYMRNGTVAFKKITDTFNISNTALRLHFQDEWGEFTPDQSEYNNDGNIVNFSSNSISDNGPAYGALEQKSIRLNEDSYITIPHSESSTLSGSCTIASWIYSDNWTDNPGSGIISTNFRSGVELKYNKHFYNPIISIIEDTYGHVLQYSQCNPIADTRVSIEE